MLEQRSGDGIQHASSQTQPRTDSAEAFARHAGVLLQPRVVGVQLHSAYQRRVSAGVNGAGARIHGLQRQHAREQSARVRVRLHAVTAAQHSHSRAHHSAGVDSHAGLGGACQECL